MSRRPVVALSMRPDLVTALFGPRWRERLNEIVELHAGLVPDDGDVGTDFADVEVLVGCWGCVRLDAVALGRMPRLRALVYAAGSVKDVVTDEALARGVRVSSAASANALPVAEYTLAAILWSGKRVLELAERYRAGAPLAQVLGTERLGNFGATIGIVGASRIGRRVVELLAPFDFEVLVYDPTLKEPVPGAESVGLDELLARSDVVSLHAPALPETQGLIGSEELARMRTGATLINTARGALVDEHALVRELRAGRLRAILDVTEGHRLPPGSDLFTAPGAFLTPHIAGSEGNELARLGDSALRELRRFADGVEFLHPVPLDQLARIA